MRNNLVFSIIEQALGRELDSIDKELIEMETALEEICLTVPTNLDVLRDIEFFQRNQKDYYMIQLGEYLSFKNLELDKPFVAYTKNPVGKCGLADGKMMHEMVAYKSELC